MFAVLENRKRELNELLSENEADWCSAAFCFNFVFAIFCFLLFFAVGGGV